MNADSEYDVIIDLGEHGVLFGATISGKVLIKAQKQEQVMGNTFLGETNPTQPDLKPLWALVEDWSSEASAAMDNSNNYLRRNDKISSEQWRIHGSKLRQCAAALRIQLEAMQ